jgi:hypothetical protein
MRNWPPILFLAPGLSSDLKHGVGFDLDKSSEEDDGRKFVTPMPEAREKRR